MREIDAINRRVGYNWSSVKKKDRLNIINLYSANLHIFLHDHKAISSCNGYEFL